MFVAKTNTPKIQARHTDIYRNLKYEMPNNKVSYVNTLGILTKFQFGYQHTSELVAGPVGHTHHMLKISYGY